MSKSLYSKIRAGTRNKLAHVTNSSKQISRWCPKKMADFNKVHFKLSHFFCPKLAASANKISGTMVWRLTGDCWTSAHKRS